MRMLRLSLLTVLLLIPLASTADDDDRRRSRGSTVMITGIISCLPYPVELGGSTHVGIGVQHVFGMAGPPPDLDPPRTGGASHVSGECPGLADPIFEAVDGRICVLGPLETEVFEPSPDVLLYRWGDNCVGSQGAVLRALAKMSRAAMFVGAP